MKALPTFIPNLPAPPVISTRISFSFKLLLIIGQNFHQPVRPLGPQVPSQKRSCVETTFGQNQFLGLTSRLIHQCVLSIGCYPVTFTKDKEFRAILELLKYRRHLHLRENIYELLPVDPYLETTQVHPDPTYQRSNTFQPGKSTMSGVFRNGFEVASPSSHIVRPTNRQLAIYFRWAG